MKRYDLRGTMIIGGWLTAIGSILRVIATLSRHQLGGSGAYALVLIGQICGGLAQPSYVNLPPAIAANWFDLTERDKATTIITI